MTKKAEKERMDEVIGVNIRLERELRSLTRDELAELMGLTNSHMGLIERGERGATAVTLARLSRVFDIPIDNLFVSKRYGGLSVKEELDPRPQTRRKKINSLISSLGEKELDFVIHTIKGVIAMDINVYDDNANDDVDDDAD